MSNYSSAGSVLKEYQERLDSKLSKEIQPELFSQQQEAESLDTLEKLEDFGIKIGGARKDTAEKGKPKSKNTDNHPNWAKKNAILTDKHGSFQVENTKINLLRTNRKNIM